MSIVKRNSASRIWRQHLHGWPLATRTILAVVCLAVGAVAQSVPVPIPRNVILPNHDRVFIGPMEALEAGAYLARTDDASASFYNPAGLAAAEKTSLSASVDGFYWTQLTSRALGQTTTSSKMASTPGHFAFVLGRPFIKGNRLRLGFAITKSLSWVPAATDQASPGVLGTIPTLTRSSRVAFLTVVRALSVGYRSSPRLRLGLSVSVARTTYSDQETLSGELVTVGMPSHFLSTLRASGSIHHLIGSFGVQWDATPRLKVGAMLRSTGLRLQSRSRFTYESAVASPGAAAWAFFRDKDGAFHYRQPLEASAGVAYHLGRARGEIDIRYHGNAGQYTMYTSSQPLIVQTRQADGTTTTSKENFRDIPYSSRSVVNIAAGARFKVNRRLTFHGGSFVSLSPIGDPSDSPFQKADLYGVTLGGAFTGQHWLVSAGLAGQFGNSAKVQARSGADTETDLEWRSLTLLYALGYRF